MLGLLCSKEREPGTYSSQFSHHVHQSNNHQWVIPQQSSFKLSLPFPFSTSQAHTGNHDSSHRTTTTSSTKDPTTISPMEPEPCSYTTKSTVTQTTTKMSNMSLTWPHDLIVPIHHTGILPHLRPRSLKLLDRRCDDGRSDETWVGGSVKRCCSKGWRNLQILKCRWRESQWNGRMRDDRIRVFMRIKDGAEESLEAKDKDFLWWASMKSWKDFRIQGFGDVHL